MAKGHQFITLVGALPADPVLRYTQEGKAVCKFSIPVDAHDGETQWWNISAWASLGETCAQQLRKGSIVQVVGAASARLYTTHGGETALSLEVNARSINFVSDFGIRQGKTELTDDEKSEIPF